MGDNDDWKEQLAVEMTRNVRRRVPRRRMFAEKADSNWSIDLMDLTKRCQSVNRNYRYALIAVDIFSRFVRGEPMKLKNATACTEAFKAILDRSKPAKPRLLIADQGGEFWNRKFRELLDEHDIVLYATYQDVKASNCERAIRSLRRLLRKRMIHTNSTVWYNELQPIIDEYNDRRHRVIKMTPREALLDKNHAAVYRTQFPDSFKEQMPAKLPKFLVGQKVRISIKKGPFSKESNTGWSEAVYEIRKYLPNNPQSYLLKDLLGVPIDGAFYEGQLQATDQSMYRIDKVIRRRKTKLGKRQSLVSWHGYGPEFSSWVDDDEIEER